MDETTIEDLRRDNLEQPSPRIDQWLIHTWLAPAVQKALREARRKKPMRRARQREMAQEVPFRALAEEAPIAIFYTDVDGHCLYVNPRWSELSGFPQEDAYGEGWAQAVHPEDRAHVFAWWHRRIATGEAACGKFRYQRPDGSLRWILGQGTPIYDDASHSIAGYIGTLTDITEEQSAQGFTNQGKLAFTRQLLHAQEEERRRIARELHDEVGQALTVLKMGLQEIQQQPALQRERLEESIGLVDHVMEQMRTMIADLRPAPLETLGLAAALRWYVGRQARRDWVNIQLNVDNVDRRLPEAIEVGCFRIVQEALMNTIKHAQAQQVTIEVRQSRASLHLWITDDGVGFDVDGALMRAATNGSFGILGMQERAHLAGGHLQVKSRHGHGTQVRAWFPLLEQE